MSNSSSTGDSLGISVGRNPTTGSTFTASGWFDIKHWCAETGVITDHSGSNSLSSHGQNRMFRGITGSSATAALTAGPYLVFSNATNALGLGVAHPVLASAEFFTTTATSAVVNAGSSELWTLTGTTSVFGDEAITGSPGATNSLKSETIMLECDSAGTVNSVQVVDYVSGGTSLALAGRSTAGTATPDRMITIILGVGDTLTVSYTFTIEAT